MHAADVHNLEILPAGWAATHDVRCQELRQTSAAAEIGRKQLKSYELKTNRRTAVFSEANIGLERIINRPVQLRAGSR